MQNIQNNCELKDENREKTEPFLSRFQTFLILIIIAVAGVIISFLNHDKMEKRYTYPCMGTIVDITFFENDTTAEKAAAAVFAELSKIEKMCSLFDTESELYQLNKNAANAPFVCSKELYELLLYCKKAHTDTDGAFDITSKALMDLWGFYIRQKEIPSDDEIKETLKKVGMDKVVFNDRDRSVFFTVKGLAFDLGGVAKGAALDRALAAAGKAGAKNGIINIGGNIACFGKNRNNRDFFEIGIRNPQNRHSIIRKIRIKDQFCATSGDYERFVIIDSKRYAHIMDPATGYPVKNMYSSTVVAEKGIDSDIYSTACFILGEKFAEKSVKNGVIKSAFLVYSKNNRITNKNITREEKK